MKNLRTDDEGIALFDWVFDPTQIIDLLKVFAVAALLFVFGLISLMGKFATLPKFIGFILGVICIGFAVWIVYLGEFPTW